MSSEDRRIITLPVTWETARRLKDRSVSLHLKTTKEVSSDDFHEIDRLLGGGAGANGWFVFIDNNSTEIDVATLNVPKENAPVERGAKTPSQRLRAVLYVRYQQLGSPGDDFEIWYRQEMDYVIGEYKALLEDRPS